MPKVSVVIPVYNIGDVLGRCLDSVVNQSHSNLQILLVDDGSSDNSLDICQQYARQDNRIEVYHHDNHGVSYTRNVGIRNSTGEYIIFIDGDDYISADYINDLVNTASANGADIVICGIKRSHLDGTEELLTLPVGAPDKQTFWTLCCTSQSPLFGYTPNKLYNVELLRKTRLHFNTRMQAQEDLHFALRAYTAASKIVISHNCGYTYFYARGKRPIPVHSLIQNQLMILETAQKHHVAHTSQAQVSKRICEMIFAYSYAIPSRESLRTTRNIPGLTAALKLDGFTCRLEVRLVAFLFRLHFFGLLQAYMTMRKTIKFFTNGYK